MVTGILAVVFIGLLFCPRMKSDQIKTGQIYIYQNACNYPLEKWESKPSPYVKIMTVMQVTNGYPICRVVGVCADGQQWDRVENRSFEHLHSSSKVR